MIIVTISGKAESGKDTSALMLKEKLERDDKKCLIVHYADLLKFYAKQYFGWSGNKDNEGRTLLQKLGTDIVRARQPDFWVNAVANFIEVFESDYDYFFIPDTRFKGEIYHLLDRNFRVITLKVNRPNHQNNLTPEQRLHPSETSLDDFVFDYEIMNLEGLNNLEREVDIFVFTLLAKEISNEH